jgi:glycosyltransferase involved in cell wall biosynthesis
MRTEVPRYSVIIPVYKSADIVGDTIDQTVAFFEKHNLNYELILVNDGSPDQSWAVLRDKAAANPHVVAINFLRNYGQHTAIFCGLQHSTGDYAITMDDDLQNPPEEIIHLIHKGGEGYDLVFGQFRSKQHASYRRVGTRIIGAINIRVFHKPDDLVLSNFRLIRRDVVDRICNYQTGYPYIPGLALMFAANPANVMVEHQPRPVGKSNYNWFKITELVMRILFNYSSYPLRLVSLIGGGIAALSLLLGVYFLIKALFVGTSVQGWASVVVLLSFFNGIVILILSMLGEYTIRLLQQTSQANSYHIKEIVRSDG